MKKKATKGQASKDKENLKKVQTIAVAMKFWTKRKLRSFVGDYMSYYPCDELLLSHAQTIMVSTYFDRSHSEIEEQYLHRDYLIAIETIRAKRQRGISVKTGKFVNAPGEFVIGAEEAV